MQDQHAGKPGTFIVDPEAGIRVPAADWDAYQQDKAAKAQAGAKKSKSDKQETVDA